MASQPAGTTTGSTSHFLELGWTSGHIQIGIGYDFAGRQLRDTALVDAKSIKLEQTGDLDIDYNITSVATDKDLKSRIKADFKANVPLEGVSITTENSYLSSLETSKTSLTRIIQETIVGPPARADTHELQLTEDAKNLLATEGWDKFRAKYGEYFVYGYIPRARFSAIASIKTSNETTRDEIKSSLEVGVTAGGSLTAALDSIKSSKTESINIDIVVEINGLKKSQATGEATTEKPGKNEKDPEPQQVVVKTNQIEVVQRMYENFKENRVLQPYIGLLCHYSVLSSTKIPLPQNQFSFLGPDIERMYKSLFTAQIEISTSPMVQASSTSRKISELCDKIKALDLTKTEAIANVRTEVASCLTEVDAWRLRGDLIGDVAKLKNNNMNEGKGTEAFSQREWASGVLGLEGSEKYGSLKGEVTWKSDHFRETPGFGYQHHISILGDNDKYIIGYKISSYWNDNSNGWFKWLSGNVLSSEVKVDFCTYSGRGCDWQIEVWMVPKLAYEKKKDP